MSQTFEKQNIEEFLALCVKKLCPVCGQPIVQNSDGRPKRFCSNLCRQKFWKRHPNRKNWIPLVCPVCGRTFFVPRENTRTRTYCSRACANRGRTRKGVEDENC